MDASACVCMVRSQCFCCCGFGVAQGSVLRPLLFIVYIFEFFHIVGNHIVGYAIDTTIYSDLSRPLSRPQVMESLNQVLAAIKFWCVKSHMRLNPKKMKSVVVSRYRASAPGYGELSFGGAELEKL